MDQGTNGLSNMEHVKDRFSTCIWDMSYNVKEFKLHLKNCLYSNTFYTLEDYFQYNNT